MRLFWRSIIGKLPYSTTLNSQALTVRRTTSPRIRASSEQLLFGHTFTDHMLKIYWDEKTGWSAPIIEPFGDLSIPPSASSLHYAIQCFEGMKAYKDAKGHTRLFRPELNMERFLQSAKRLSLPEFDKKEVLECIKKLVLLDEDWIPTESGYSLYVRPTLIGMEERLGVGPSSRALLYVLLSPVGPYYRTGFNAVSLYAENRFVRAWPGGTGSFKIGANYAGSVLPQRLAAERDNCQQVLWLFGPEQDLAEVGTMNCFVFWQRRDGVTELITPSLADGTILPGVTRDSVLELARRWNESTVTEGRVTMGEVISAVEEKRMLEMFGTGTAAIVSPIKAIKYGGQTLSIPIDESTQSGPLAKRVWKAITEIQYGQVESPWSQIIK